MDKWNFLPCFACLKPPYLYFFPLSISNARQFYSGMNALRPGLTNGKLNVFAVNYAYHNNLKNRFHVALRLFLYQGASATRKTATATRTSFQNSNSRYFNRFVTI